MCATCSAASSPRSTASVSRTSRRRPTTFCARAQHPTLGRPYLECGYAPMLELLRLPRGERVHQLHRLGRRSRLHAADHPEAVRHPARAGDRQRPLDYFDDSRRHDHAQGRGRVPRRRPAEADPHLEPHRPSPARRRRQLERRHPDAGVHEPRRTSRPCGCSCSTTTPSGSSTTPPAPSRRSSAPARTAGRS